MKIVWIDLNCSYAHASLALPAVHAQVMHNADMEWEVVRCTTNELHSVVVNEVCKLRPDVVCASAWLFTHEYLLHVVSRVKSLIPHVVVALGGPEFLGDNETYLRHHPEVSVVFRGEGERSVPMWLKVYNQPPEWHNIPGLCYIHESKYYDEGIARVMDFDNLLPPEKSPFFAWDKPFVQLETTRGCFNTCAFCVSGMGDPIRKLHLDKIKQRLSELQLKGVKEVRILDRTFNDNPKEAISILSLFEEFYPSMRFHLEIHPALLTPSLRKKIAEMPEGLLHLEAGMQSLNPDVIKLCQRKGIPEKALDGLKFLASKSTLTVHADLIAGLPDYTLKDLYSDIHVLASCRVDEIQLESLKVLPGTLLKKYSATLGIMYAQLPPYEVLSTNAMTTEDLISAMKFSRLLDGYYNTKSWQEVTRLLMLKHSNFLFDFMTYLADKNCIDQPLSLERRGELLYDFCGNYLKQELKEVVMAWIEAGMSLKKHPAELVKIGRIKPPKEWQVIYGEYSEDMRLCCLPIESEGIGIWYAYERLSQRGIPTFKALGDLPEQ